jgi:hypothetical protein
VCVEYEGLAQLVEEKSNKVDKVDILWAMGDFLPEVDSSSNKTVSLAQSSQQPGIELCRLKGKCEM